MRPRIRTQAYLVSAIPLVFLVLLLVLALLIQNGSTKGAELERRTQRILTQEAYVETLVTDASRSATTQTAAHRPRAAALIKAQREIGPSTRTLQKLVAAQPPMRRIAAHLAQLQRSAVALIVRYADLIRAGRSREARALAAAKTTQQLGQQLQSAMQTFSNTERAFELWQLDALRAQMTRYEFALVVCCAAGILLTLMVSGRFGLSIAERIRQLAQNAERLASGKDAQPLTGSDELADLDKVYRAMIARMRLEHTIASTLQRILLPERLPDVDGLRIDTVYAPAAAEEGVGGDWYDVFLVNDRTICLSVGDVAGHGLRAATVMAGARLAVRTCARMRPDPAFVLNNVNRIVCADEPETMVTAFFAVLDLESGTLSYASAGHPPPLLISPDGNVTLLEAQGYMLGADDRAEYDVHTIVVREGFGIVLYTDGIVEVERDYLRGQQELIAAARDEFLEPSDNIALAILNRVMGDARARDDAAVVFVGITAIGSIHRDGSRHVWTLDAREEGASRRVKRALLWRLGERAQPRSDLSSVELILGELIGNVARHTPGPAEVALEFSNGKATLSVSDRGTPFEAKMVAADPFAESGRGLFLVRSIADDVRVEHHAAGNTVTAVLPVALA